MAKNDREKTEWWYGRKTKDVCCVYCTMYMSEGANDKWLFSRAYVWYSIFIYFSSPFETFVTPLPYIVGMILSACERQFFFHFFFLCDGKSSKKNNSVV